MSKESKHLKRIAMPRSWPFPRKGNKYVTRPLPGKKRQYAIPICMVLRDMIQVASTKKEVRGILLSGNALVDNKIVKDESFPVGLFDILALPKIKRYYRMEFSRKGKLSMQGITEKEAYLKPCKIIGKKILRKGRVQLNLYDGKNFLCRGKIKEKVNDSVLIDLKQNKIVKQLPLEKGSPVCVIGGKNIGAKGNIVEIEKNFVIVKTDSKQVKTPVSNIFVTE